MPVLAVYLLAVVVLHLTRKLLALWWKEKRKIKSSSAPPYFCGRYPFRAGLINRYGWTTSMYVCPLYWPRRAISAGCIHNIIQIRRRRDMRSIKWRSFKKERERILITNAKREGNQNKRKRIILGSSIENSN